VPQLRSLNIANIADYVTERFEPRDLAMQIVNIITLCPSIQLCYVGIASKCFEILESAPSDALSPMMVSRGQTAEAGPNGAILAIDGGDEADHDDDSEDDQDDEDDDDDDDDETDEEGDADGEDGASAEVTDPDATQSEDGGAAHESDDEESNDGFVDPDLAAGRVRLRLREILFYDDKVAIFKARHARL
jgi:hypothetical protein